jgi:hypothetical protein
LEAEVDELKKSKTGFVTYWVTGSMVALMGIASLAISVGEGDIESIIKSLGFIGLGLAYSYLSIETVLNFKLNVICRMIGAEKGKRRNWLVFQRNVFQLAGILAFYGGIVIQGLSLLKILPSEFVEFSLAIEVIGLALVSIGGMYRTNERFDDIYQALLSMNKKLGDIEEGISKVGNQTSRIKRLARRHGDRRKRK